MIFWILGIREVDRSFIGESALLAGGVQSRHHVVVAASRGNGSVAEIEAADGVGGHSRVRAAGKSPSINMVADDRARAGVPDK